MLRTPYLISSYHTYTQVKVTYALSESNNKAILSVEYEAVTTDKPTIINLTNHSYFNLSGNYKDNITAHYLQLYCSSYLPIDSNQIPTGEIVFIPEKTGSGHANSGLGQELFDFRSPTLLGEILPLIDGGGRPGLDHCFVVDGYRSSDNLASSGLQG